jgi:hypothetical protein
MNAGPEVEEFHVPWEKSAARMEENKKREQE